MLIRRKIGNLFENVYRTISIFHSKPLIYHFSEKNQMPFVTANTYKDILVSLLSKKTYKINEIEQYFDSCLFLVKINNRPDISLQQHQRILLDFNELLDYNNLSVSIIKKFIKYVQAFNLANRINSTKLIKSLIHSRKTIMEEQKNVPEILNFLTQSNASRSNLMELLDEIIPIYDKNLSEIDDSTLISLFYHVIYLQWNYDKKPEIYQKSKEKPKGKWKKTAKKEDNEFNIDEDNEKLFKFDKIKESTSDSLKPSKKSIKISKNPEEIDDLETESVNKSLKSDKSDEEIDVFPEKKLEESELVSQKFHEFKSNKSEKNTFLRGVELELGLRLSRMRLQDFLEFSRVLSLNSINNYKNHELFLEYQRILLIKLETMSETDLMYVIGNLRFFNKFSDEFCNKFEIIMKNRIDDYKTLNLYLLLQFVRGLSFKSRSSLIYNILLVINKNNMKSIAASISEGIEQYGKNRETLTFLINDLMFFAANQVEEQYMLRYSFFPKKIIRFYLENILQKDVLTVTARKNIIRKIWIVTNIRDFRKLMIIVNKLNIRDSKILDALLNVFLQIIKYNELNLHQYCEILSSFLELNYYIDFTEHKKMIENFLKTLNNYTQSSKVYEQYSSFKILSIFIRYAKSFNHELLSTFIESFDKLADQVIKKKIFFSYLERIEILSHITLSNETCNLSLIYYIYSFFNYKRNPYFIKEADYMPRNNILNRLTERITHYHPQFKVTEDLIPLLEKTKDYSKKENIVSHALYFSSNFALHIKSEISQYLELIGILNKIEIIESVYEHTFEIDIKLKDLEKKRKDIYIDVHGAEKHCHVNMKNIPNAITLAKGDYLRNILGIQYLEIHEEEWVNQENKRNILIDKLKSYLA